MTLAFGIFSASLHILGLFVLALWRKLMFFDRDCIECVDCFGSIDILTKFVILLFFFQRLFIFWGQTETEHERGIGRERGRHRIGNRLQALSHQPRA